MKNIQEENAVIESVEIQYDRGEFLCPYVHVSGKGWGVGFGGVVCDRKDSNEDCRSLTGQFIMRVLNTVGVERWSDLEGRPVRIRHRGAGRAAVAIGHFLRDDWFYLEELSQK